MIFFSNASTRSDQGFTLIEVMTAIVLLTIGILSLYALHVTSINSNLSASNMTTACNWASDRIEILLSRGYNHSDLEDDNGNGTNQDANNDGIDDSGGNSIDYTGGAVDAAGGNFGLNSGLTFNAAGVLTGVNKALADGRATLPDNRYTMLWNVAIDTPVPNSKTIRVIVTFQDRGVIKNIPLTYIKSTVL